MSHSSLSAAPASLSAQTFAGLPATQYEFTIRAEAAAEVPTFPGSTLRGAFGHALKRAVCVMPHRNCGKCLVVSRCLYPQIFETVWPQGLEGMEKQQNAPHPFVLTPPVFPRTRVEQGAEEKGSGRAGERESEGSMEAEDDTKAPLPTQAPVPAPPSAPPPFPNSRPPAHWSHIRQIQQGETVTCGMTLLGAANAALPYLVLAWHELAAQGLGRGRQPFVLDSVARVSPAGERQPIYDARTQRLDAADTGYGLNDYVAARLAGWPVDAGADAPVTVRFVTPARVMHQGRLQARADFSLLVRTLLRRVSLAQLAHGAGPLVLPFRALLDEAATVTPGLARWSWWDWGRWSERQQTRMKLGGFIGRAEFSGPALTGFLPLLAAGEVLGLGSSTSFGLGRIEIECPAGATPERTA